MWNERAVESAQEAEEIRPVFVRNWTAAYCPQLLPQVINGFPRYSTTVSSLPNSQQQKLRTIALEIVRRSQSGCQPVIRVTLIGHADRDPQRGTAFEQRISQDRAQAIRRALEASINNRQIDSRITWQVTGLGASALMVPIPRTEAERMRNRRVEIELFAGAPARGGPTAAPIRILDRFQVGQSRLFAFHKPRIRHVASHILASWRRGIPIQTVLLVGHADETGQPAFNVTLGNNRAIAVEKGLAAELDRLQAGLSRRIQFVRESRGASDPSTTDRTPQGRARNRRVEIFLVGETLRRAELLRIRSSAEREATGTRPKVVLIPGVMGSVLRDPTVPSDLCQTAVISSRAYRAFKAGLRVALSLVVGPILAEVALRQLESALCAKDMSVIWGTWDMLPWLFIPDHWCNRLLQGDCQSRPSNVTPAGFETLRNSYDPILPQLRAVADVLPFAYDWRLSLDENARMLEAAIKAWSALGEDKVTIIAHSMGGLVARNFIESTSRKGADIVNQLITAGTPHDGAPENYAHFNRKSLPFGIELPFSPFVNPGMLAAVMAAMVPALGPVISKLPTLLIPTLMPADMQLELIRSFAGVIQLLPNSPFAGIPGRHKEPVASSYSRISHLRGTARPVLDVIDLLRRDMFGGTGGIAPPGRTLGDLNSFLASKRVRYHTLAGVGTNTVTGFDVVITPPDWVSQGFRSCVLGNVSAEFRDGAPTKALVGDKTVPLASAQLLPAGTNVIVPAARPGVDHGSMLKDLEVRKYCFRQIGAPEPTHEMEEERLEVEPLTLSEFTLGAEQTSPAIGLSVE